MYEFNMDVYINRNSWTDITEKSMKKNIICQHLSQSVIL